MQLKKPRWLIGVMLVVFAMAFTAACGGSDDETTGGGGAADTTAAGGDTTAADGGGEAIKTAVLLNGKGDDQTWNTSMVDSVSRAVGSANLDVISTVESVTPADGPRAMREAIEQGGAQIVIAHASALDQATQEVAAEYPDVCFIQAFGTGEPPANVSYYFDNASGANYLAGMAAASVSEGGTIGVVGGVDLDEIVASVEAFKMGAMRVNPDIEVLVTWVGDFEDPLKGKEAGLAQISQGADVVYAYGDGTGLGTVEAAKEQNVPIIGAWFDQYELAPELTITSFVSNWEPIIAQVADKYRTDGSGACGIGAWVADLANNGAYIAPYHDWEDKLSDEVKADIETAKAAIIDGSLDPVTGQSS